MSWTALFWIGFGGALGSVLRAWLGFGIKTEFPWATMLANVFGCLIIGLVIGHESVTTTWSQNSRAFVVLGFCGGFTTFSTFGMQTIKQLESGQIAAAIANIMLSLIVCLFAVWAGIWAGKIVFQGG